MLAINTFVALLALVTPLHVRADVSPLEPAPGDSFDEGSTCKTTWAGDSNSTTIWKNMAIELMTGSNADMIHLTSNYPSFFFFFNFSSSPCPLQFSYHSLTPFLYSHRHGSRRYCQRCLFLPMSVSHPQLCHLLLPILQSSNTNSDVDWAIRYRFI